MSALLNNGKDLDLVPVFERHARAILKGYRIAILKFLSSGHIFLNGYQIEDIQREILRQNSIAPMKLIPSKNFWIDLYAEISGHEQNQVYWNKSLAEWATERALDELLDSGLLQKEGLGDRVFYKLVEHDDPALTAVEKRQRVLMRVARTALGPEAGKDEVLKLKDFIDISRGVYQPYSTLDGSLVDSSGKILYAVIYPTHVEWRDGVYSMRSAEYVVVKSSGACVMGQAFSRQFKDAVLEINGSSFAQRRLSMNLFKVSKSGKPFSTDYQIFPQTRMVSLFNKKKCDLTYVGGGRGVAQYLGLNPERGYSIAYALRPRNLMSRQSKKKIDSTTMLVGRLLSAFAKTKNYGRAVFVPRTFQVGNWNTLFPHPAAGENDRPAKGISYAVAGERRRQFVLTHPFFAHLIFREEQVNVDNAPRHTRRYLLNAIDRGEEITRLVAELTALPVSKVRRLRGVHWQRLTSRSNDGLRGMESHISYSMAEAIVKTAPDHIMNTSDRFFMSESQDSLMFRRFMALAPMEAMPRSRWDWVALCGLFHSIKAVHQRFVIDSVQCVIGLLRANAWSYRKAIASLGENNLFAISHSADALEWLCGTLSSLVEPYRKGLRKTQKNWYSSTLRFFVGNIEKMTPLDWIRVSNQWHERDAQFRHDVKSVFMGEGQTVNLEKWEPLTPEVSFETSGGTKARWLLTTRELETEGLEMHHCVGGYTSQCLFGQSHILSLSYTDGSRSTLEVRVIPSRDNNEGEKKRPWNILEIQNQAPYNKEPTPLALQETKKILSHLRQTISDERLSELHELSRIRVQASQKQRGYHHPTAFAPNDEQAERLLEIIRPYLHKKHRRIGLNELRASVVMPQETVVPFPEGRDNLEADEIMF